MYSYRQSIGLIFGFSIFGLAKFLNLLIYGYYI